MPMNRQRPSSQTEAAGDMVVGGAGAGLGGLRKEVSTCEYHDVHVMWEMLSSVSSSNSNTIAGKASNSKQMMETKKKKKRGSLPVAYWSRLLSYCCGAL